MSEDDKARGIPGHHYHHHHNHNHPPPQPYPPPQYGTFQDVNNNLPPPPEPHPAIGFPQPVPPRGATEPSAPPPPTHPYYAHGYQTVPGYVFAEGTPVRERRLHCCGLGCGWFLFILGFFLAAIPWYVGAIIMLCSRVDHQEKPGYIACIVAAVLATIAVILGVTKGVDDW